jgi:hypothetical protein
MKAQTKIILNRTTRASERYTLINNGRGMGGAGKDRAHYLRNWCVVSGVDRGNGYQGYYSIDHVLHWSFTGLTSAEKQTIRATLGITENE